MQKAIGTSVLTVRIQILFTLVTQMLLGKKLRSNQTTSGIADLGRSMTSLYIYSKNAASLCLRSVAA